MKLLSNEEIAEDLGLTSRMIRHDLVRLKVKIRLILKKRGFDLPLNDEELAFLLRELQTGLSQR